MQGVRQQKGVLSYKGEVQDLPARHIREDTCKLWSYRCGELDGQAAQFAYYLDDSKQPVAAKVRFRDKTFKWIGDPSKAGLYGKWLWPSGGKMVVIVEGEVDALTMSQLQNNRWPVVSIPNGSASAVKSLKADLDWLSTFDKVILMFDMDKPGQEAAQACAELFEPGTCSIASLPLKDANECLVNNRGDEALRAMWNAPVWRPDGIVAGADLWERVSTFEHVESIPYPWSCLNKKTHGLRKQELVTFTAGSGIGKSQIVREIAYSLIQRGENVGMIMLEESIRKTSLDLMGMYLNKRLSMSEDAVDRETLRTAFDATLGTGRVYMYDHFGSTQVDRLLARVRHLAKGFDCGWIILDHLSILVSALDDASGLDERKLIDRTMTLLRTMVQETGVGLIVVSHLKRPEGNRGHEEGAVTSLSQLRGSHAIAQLSDMVIGLERNQQDDESRDQTVVRILKNRFSGETGEACTLYYDHETGRLNEAPAIKTEF